MLSNRKELEGGEQKSGKETEKGKGPGWKWEKEKGRWRKEYGGLGGGGENGLKCPHYPIDYEGGGGGEWRMNLEFCRLHLDFCRYIGISSVRQQRTLLYRQNTCDLPIEYGEELRVSDQKLRNFRLAWLN